MIDVQQQMEGKIGDTYEAKIREARALAARVKKDVGSLELLPTYNTIARVSVLVQILNDVLGECADIRKSTAKEAKNETAAIQS